MTISITTVDRMMKILLSTQVFQRRLNWQASVCGTLETIIITTVIIAEC